MRFGYWFLGLGMVFGWIWLSGDLNEVRGSRVRHSFDAGEEFGAGYSAPFELLVNLSPGSHLAAGAGMSSVPSLIQLEVRNLAPEHFWISSARKQDFFPDPEESEELSLDVRGVLVVSKGPMETLSPCDSRDLLGTLWVSPRDDLKWAEVRSVKQLQVRFCGYRQSAKTR